MVFLLNAFSYILKIFVCGYKYLITCFFFSSFWLAGFCRRSLTSQCQPRPLHVKFRWRLTLRRTWCGISASWRVKWRGSNAAFALQSSSVSPCLITHACTPALLHQHSLSAIILQPEANKLFRELEYRLNINLNSSSWYPYYIQFQIRISTCQLVVHCK